MAGYVLTYPFPVALYPPKESDNAIWYLHPDQIQSHHNQGRLQGVLQTDVVADPEPIDRLLDINLGFHRITPSGHISLPYGGDSIISLINFLIRSRRELVCRGCFEGMRQYDLSSCSCTLRKRFWNTGHVHHAI